MHYPPFKKTKLAARIEFICRFWGHPAISAPIQEYNNGR